MNYWIAIFSFFALFALLLFILFFFKKKGDKIANRLLGFYIFLFGYNIFFHVLFWTKKLATIEFIHLIFTDTLTWVLYGPVIFFYVRRISFSTKFSKKDIIHFIPMFLVLINYLKLFYLNAQEKYMITKQKLWPVHILFPTEYLSILAIVLQFIYFVLLFKMISDQNELNKGSDKTKWLNWILILYLSFIISFSIVYILSHSSFKIIEYDYVISLPMVLLIAMTAYFGFMQPYIFEGLPIEDVIPRPIKSSSKYKKTGLSKEFSIELKDKLQDLMNEEKIFLSGSLNLIQVATLLNVPRNYASQVINQHFGMSYYDFVNFYRVKEIKEILKKSDVTISSLTELSYSVGFNNRISFYKAFKKFSGKSPSEYLKNLNSSNC